MNHPAPEPANGDRSTRRGFFNSNWFLSSSVRHATHMRKLVWKLLCAQRDILSPQAIDAIETAVSRTESTCWSTRDKSAIEAELRHLESTANKWLKPYPSASVRENVEVLLVAIAVAMAIRTFFAQPFKIPTGSMQPTLYGVTSTVVAEDFEIPNFFSRFVQFWWSGVGYDLVKAEASGQLDPNTEDVSQKFLLFNLRQTFNIGGTPHTVWFPPDKLLQRAGLISSTPFGSRVVARHFNKGETVLKLKSYSGDHLFVDRLTYNFRKPKRGEIIVFETKDIAKMDPSQQGQFYIKRMVGMGEEKVRILNDRHLEIDGKRLDSSTPHFENIYSFDPAKDPAESQYSGHVNETYRVPGVSLAPFFPDENAVFEVPPHHYIVMGDNTMNSADSRSWGSFPQENVIGKSWLVYWPFGRQDGRGSRFGWGTR